ncbi:MAG: hypothetical protein IPG24_21395 [Leptospiraceae bacterium]|nr:hypothetical protein [Leptospiraceae bacterium]
MLELYSTYSFLIIAPVLNLIENIKLSDVDFLIKEKFLEFVQTKLNEYETRLSNLYKGEIYLLLAELHIINHNTQYARAAFKKSLSFLYQINPKETIYIDARLRRN